MADAIWRQAEAANDAVAATGLRVGRLMTMAFIVLDVRSGDGVYLNAAHIPVYMRQAGRFGSMLTGGEFLGEFTGAVMKTRTFHLDAGDVLILCTDGLFENGGGIGTKFRVKDLRRILADEDSVAAIERGMQERYAVSLGGEKPVDDCSYVILRRA